MQPSKLRIGILVCAHAINRFCVLVLTLLIRAYQVGLRPLLIGHCKFYPSCSDYSQQALATHGTIRGLLLTAKRVVRCHPWGAGGIDLVPAREPE